MPHVPQPCPPESQSCAYEERVYRCSADQLFNSARQAVQELGPDSARIDYENRRIQALFSVIFLKGDLDLVVQADGKGAILVARSTSRVGNDSSGMNRRRINALLRGIAQFYG